MRGGPALNGVLEGFPGAPIRAIVVWEPVLATDVSAPFSSVLALLPDARVAQFWDPERTLSRDIVRAVATDPRRYGFEKALSEDFIVWDVVAVFGADAQWSLDLPVPSYYDGPVYAATIGLQRAIEDALESDHLEPNHDPAR